MIIDGKKIAREIQAEIKSQVSGLPIVPVFCDILVGNDPASRQYVNMKAKAAENVGFKFRRAEFPADISTQNLIGEIKSIGGEKKICGLIVQLPLPVQIDKHQVLDAIDPRIDVDCTGKANSDLFYQGKAYLEFPTAAAVMKILDHTGQDFAGQRFLVVGFGQLVGRPVSFLLKRRGYSVDVARSKTENILELIKNADVVISAAGKPKLITGEKLNPEP